MLRNKSRKKTLNLSSASRFNKAMLHFGGTKMLKYSYLLQCTHLFESSSSSNSTAHGVHSSNKAKLSALDFMKNFKVPLLHEAH